MDGRTELTRTGRRFERFASVEDFRRAARRRLPRAIFDFIDGGAGLEQTLRANEAAFRSYALMPRLLTDVSARDLGIALLGRAMGLPLLLGPSGMQRLAHREGELAAVRAAARSGAGYVLSVGASTRLEEVAEAGRGAVLWLQIYLWDSHSWTAGILNRARAAGYDALCVTIDSKSPGGRKYRDIRNGLSGGPRPDIRSTLDSLRRPSWLLGYLASPRIKAVHLAEEGGDLGISLFRTPAVIQRRMSPSATWDEITWLRDSWDRPLVVKGILNPADAEEAFTRGADAIICSNHGGRVLDSTPATLIALPAILEVARRHAKPVLLDGGIRTGADIVKAIALGASAVLITRPFWWGLATGGQAGVEALLGILRSELDSSLTLLGRCSVADLDPSVLQRLEVSFPATAEAG